MAGNLFNNNSNNNNNNNNDIKKLKGEWKVSNSYQELFIIMAYKQK